MATVYLGLGTNLGDKEANLRTAIYKLQERIGKQVSLSSFYETAPWGFESDHSFLNAAIGLETSLSPIEILHITQEIEKELGRTKKSVNGSYSDRLIDIDILLYDTLVLQTPELTIPHPLMTERDFVMKPLIEIAGNVIHPTRQKTLSELYQG
ncbi:2-amino-4-hydroxy-6-hydroxymethyldihydropteridine diphosphokinase [Phocaeicola plebeius]|jgi:2-amino-4-hydroxy-6-hydroxymethyldihydropteridine diphosphokinase|uniref:2-amino-4-hydroxy-6- hydroxymethyldihydropteridine diphosphokinase n=1 Tax=Phocaeicola plebeius TaxID=310297 RepID=UPI0026EF7BF1|nr:2-amino-4-hydroxy-6-hydroxymethyldihydropteridine diphosphokinase [Phocaeicola plebeius]MCI6049251.1 2-amino-4-hydroxy-6-hydroxymethyldihydropteridine diphosphokinase [Phocaeicola plebeius]MDD6912930.1 2-amino-4-hydroxy-6-hydroxymethyldihydropteridine diphosphokinase [Phocaeicola plebeius]MDY5978754.1 2-amino-4-hydroxy-6-hydroxymethyldihydropteridine diphosphokinase [Phocaeicola plebeius]